MDDPPRERALSDPALVPEGLDATIVLVRHGESEYIVEGRFQGQADTPLTDDQKNQIAEVRNAYAAKLAQEEILHQSKLATTWEPDERGKLEEGHRREVQRFNDDRDRKIEKVRSASR